MEQNIEKIVPTTNLVKIGRLLVVGVYRRHVEHGVYRRQE
jgi:hypothetical protein